jgi:uncharacterized protein YjbJ (UPF0337 family)
MKASTRSTASGNANIVKGGAKKVAGKALGKQLLQVRGRAQVILGKLQKEAGKRQKSEGN